MGDGGGEGGQAVFESMIVLPLFVLILLGIVSLARIGEMRARADGAAREAAWGYGRGETPDPDRFARLFFPGVEGDAVRAAPLSDPSPVGLLDAAADRLSASTPEALRRLFDPGDLLRSPGGTQGASVEVRLDRLPLLPGRLRVRSEHHADVDPWKGATPLLTLARGAGWALGWARSVKPAVEAQRQACDAVLDVGTLGIALPANLLRAAAETALTEAVDRAIDSAVRLATREANRLTEEVLARARAEVLRPIEERVLGPLLDPLEVLSAGMETDPRDLAEGVGEGGARPWSP